MSSRRFSMSMFLCFGVAAFSGCVGLSATAPRSNGVAGVICNPLELNYRFSLKEPGLNESPVKICHREAADPSVVYYQGKYWMFLSKSGGYWWSTDLIDWTFIECSSLPMEAYAPDVRVVNDAIVFMATATPAYQSKNPMKNQWEQLTDHVFGHDPHTFQDDDGKVYGFWGCSPDKPIFGVEANPDTMVPKTKAVSLFLQNRDAYGWELRGDGHNNLEQKAYVEGPWLNKHDGVYYMQYAVPGTQFDIYNDAVYTADSPLGPYTIARHNPFAYKPAGFMTGAGHGCTFHDPYGNLWHEGTMRISLRRGFERRIGLFPAGFDRDGVLFCNTRFGDYPMNIPSAKWNPSRDSFAGLMLLSLNKPVTASSERTNHPAAHAVNEDVRTYWAGESKQDEWLQVDLGSPMSVKAIQVNLAEEECNQYGREGSPLYVQYRITGSVDGTEWETVVDKSEFKHDAPHDFELLPEAKQLRYLKITLLHMPGDGYCALSGFRVFGNKAGDRPAKVEPVTAERNADRRFMDVSWTPVDGAHGYNVLWGIAPDKLYNCMQVHGKTSAQIRALSIHESYWVAVEAFGETGVADLSEKHSVK